MHTHIRTLFVAALALSSLVSAPLFATEPVSARMLAALESVKVENLKADLFFIASDEMRGRDTPSEEQRITARFLRARLERLGWKPGAPDGYLYTYNLEQRLLDEAKCKLTFSVDGKKEEFAFAGDYFLSGSNDVRTSKAAGKLLFAGTFSFS